MPDNKLTDARIIELIGLMLPNDPSPTLAAVRVALCELQEFREAAMPKGDHVSRMMAEVEELSSRLDALEAFVDGDTFPTLEPRQQRLMVRQASLMRAYRNVLYLRIGAVPAAGCQVDGNYAPASGTLGREMPPGLTRITIERGGCKTVVEKEELNLVPVITSHVGTVDGLTEAYLAKRALAMLEGLPQAD